MELVICVKVIIGNLFPCSVENICAEVVAILVLLMMLLCYI